MNFKLRVLFAAAASCVFMVVAPVSGHAAPVTPGDASASAADVHPSATGLPNLPQASGETKTIDLLIELQPRTAGLAFNERARQPSDPRLTPVVERRDAQAAETAAPPSGLFGAGATPMVTGKKATAAADADWRPAAGGGGVSRGGGGFDGGNGGRSATADADARWLWLPRDLLRFVRDNRELVIGAAVVLLALLWGGSIAMSNSRR